MGDVKIISYRRRSHGKTTLNVKCLSMESYNDILSLHPEFEMAKAFRDLILWLNEYPLSKNGRLFVTIDASDKRAVVQIRCEDEFFMFVSDFTELSDLGHEDTLVTMDVSEDDFGVRRLTVTFTCFVERAFLNTAFAGYAKDIL